MAEAEVTTPAPPEDPEQTEPSEPEEKPDDDGGEEEPAEEVAARALLDDLGGYRSSGFVFRSAEGEVGILEGRMLPYNTWARIDSFVEGRFYEQFRPRSLTKTLTERAGQMRILFEHGMSRLLDKMPIAEFESFRDEDDGVHFRARLLPGLPDLFMEGLRRNQYGSSIRHKPVKMGVTERPGKSDHNPEGWQERSITEALVKEFSVVTFPAYEGATASVRSLTDDLYAARALEHPELLLQHLRAQAEPTHSEPPVQEDPGAGKASRATLPKPTRDWLSTDQEVPPWHIP